MRCWSCLDEPPIPAATVEMLSSLRGYQIELVTSSPAADAPALLESMTTLTLWLSGEDVKRLKQAPDSHLHMRSQLGVRIGVAFEDQMLV